MYNTTFLGPMGGLKIEGPLYSPGLKLVIAEIKYNPGFTGCVRALLYGISGFMTDLITNGVSE